MSVTDIESSITVSIEDLYKDNHGWLVGWLRKKTGCSYNAADVAHDTYLRVLAKGTAPSQDNSRRYLTRIASGLMIDRYRRKNIENTYLDTLRERPQSEIPSAETQYIIIETLLSIDNMLQALPEKIRQSLLMRQLDGMSYKDIATALNVSVSSVEKYVAKGLLACYQVLANE